MERAGRRTIVERLDERVTPPEETADAVQAASEESFPASDAPSWTPVTGIRLAEVTERPAISPSGSLNPLLHGRSLRLDGSPRTIQGSPAKRPRPADIVLLGAEWQIRALLRAQLIEEGFEVIATDTWPMMRQYLRPGWKPRLAIVDVQGLPDPERVLNDLRLLMKPNRVLVLAAIDTVSPGAIERLGFRVLKRPVSIGDVVAAATRALQEQRKEQQPMV